jgi:hypothetical protein
MYNAILGDDCMRALAAFLRDLNCDDQRLAPPWRAFQCRQRENGTCQQGSSNREQFTFSAAARMAGRWRHRLSQPLLRWCLANNPRIMMAPPQNLGKSIARAALIVRDADSMIIAAGARMDVDSGLPNFRGKNEF